MAELFKPYRRGRFLKPLPATVWPAPDAVDALEWLLRYGTPEQRAVAVEEDRLVLASVIAAYRNVVTSPAAGKQLPGLRQALKNGEVEP